MGKGRLEAFSDGVIAIIITIMVLELHVPHEATLQALQPLLPKFSGYLLSFVFIGIYWNNHHHLLHAARHVNGWVLWANLHLLFWLSLVPFATDWMSEHFDRWPTVFYGFILFMAALAYYLLSRLLIRTHGQDSLLAEAVRCDRKGIISVIAYALAIGLGFVHTGLSVALFILVAIIWFIPDPRIERLLKQSHEQNSAR